MAETVIHTRILQKRDTEANWTANNPLLLDGELAIVKTENNRYKIKIGDGVNNYNQLPYIKVDEADMVGGKLPEKIFYDNGISSDLDSATKSGCYAASPDTLNTPFPTWWLVDTMNFDNQFIVQKAHIIGGTSTTVSYIRNYANNAWSDWTEMYTSGNKPYITGEITFANKISDYKYNSSPVPTNHGFMPSKVLYWELPSDDMWNVDQRYLVESAVRFDTTSFTPQHDYTVEDNSKPPKPITSPPQYRYGYIIFK